MKLFKAYLFRALGLVTVLMTGCQSPDVYHWGHYENLVYMMYAKPDKVPPDIQAQKLEEDMRQAVAKKKPVPPGVHAHLGMLYFQLGKPNSAREQFVLEKTQFPESTVFVDRMLSNLSKQ